MTTDPWWVEPDEKRLWTGRPVPLRYVLGRVRWQLVTGTPVIGILFVAYVYWRDQSWMFFVEIALCVLGANVLFVLAKTIWRARNTIYALTERRALILVGDDSTSFWERDLHYIKVREGWNGSGDIIFREEATGVEGQRIPAQGFFAINEVGTVARLVRIIIDSPAAKLPPTGPE